MTTDIVVSINFLDETTFSVKLVKTTKPMLTKLLHFCIFWDFQLVYISALPFQKT